MTESELRRMALEYWITWDADDIVRFAREVEFAEREACIEQIQLHTPRDGHDSPNQDRMKRLIAAIRSRGDHAP